MVGMGISFLIASSNPSELADFYALVCNGQLSKGLNSKHYLITYRQTNKIQIYKPSAERWPIHSTSSALALCFEKEARLEPLTKLKEWCEEIVAHGASVLEEPRDEFFGAEAWLKDPQGNSFLLLIRSIRTVT